MSRWFCVVLFSVITTVIAGAQTSAPAARTRFVSLSYMKAQPGKAAEYLRLERELWKVVHQDMVNRGQLTSWRLYAVSWPNGDDQEYDYVTMMEYPDFAHVEAPYRGVDYAKILGSEAKVAELRTTGTTRQMRRTDTLVILQATDGWSNAQNRVLNVHYLRSLPGKGEDLLKIQRDYFLPSNNELIKAGGAAGWANMSVRFPSQLDFPYNYVSFNGYESLTQMEKERPRAWLDKWAGQDINAQLATTRKRVKGQLWRLIEQTTPPSSSPKT
jgi:hypothetical protein